MSTDHDPRDSSDSGRDPERATVSITAPSVSSGPQREPIIPAVGTLVSGKYRIEAVLGEGGMGIVLAALHVRLDRKVALKLLRPGAQTDRRALRLLREAQSTSRLQSPYVAELLDVEELADRTPYLVLERLEGETLAERFRRDKRLPLAEAADVLVQAALGLAAAHAAGIVHRDVKPSNIFLTRTEGAAARVKLLDFGIAKSVASSGDETLTGDSAVLGSPAYMSPEQTRGARDVDERTDVWALGVTLFEVLTGELPFGQGPAQAVAARVAADAPRSLAELCPECPRAVRELVASCLEKDSTKRCPSAVAFLRALAPFGTERSAALVEESFALRKTRRQRPGWIGVGFGAALVVVAAASGVVVFGTPAVRAGFTPASPSAALAAPSEPKPFGLTNLRRATFEEGCEEFPWWTADGRGITFDAASGKDTHVFLLDVSSGGRRAITSDKGWQLAASVSPKGDQMAYLAMGGGQNATYVSNLDGSSCKRLSTTDTVRPSWSPDGAFVWLGGATGPDRVDVRSGETVRHLHPPSGTKLFNVLELPDGRLVGRAIAREGDSGLVLFPPGKDEGGWLWRADVESVLELTPDGASLLAAKVTESGASELWRIPLEGAPPERVAGSGILPTKGFRISNDKRRATWSTCREQRGLTAITQGSSPGTLAIASHARANDWIDESPSPVLGTSSMLIMSTRTGHVMPCVVDTGDREPARCLDTGDLVAANPSPSPDGHWYSFDVASKGVFVAPLDGSKPPRRVVDPKGGDRQEHSAISPDGREVYFTVIDAAGTSHVEVVPFEGGPPSRYLMDGSRNITFSPRGDVAIFLLGEHLGKSTPMWLDRKSRKHHPLSPELVENNFSAVSFSASGTRAAVVRNVNEVLEVDVSSGKLLGHLDAGNDQINSVTYQGEQMIVARTLWSGNIWIADVAN